METLKKVIVIALILFLDAIGASAQEMPPALRGKTTDADLIWSKAQNDGLVRVIVQYDAPNSSVRIALGTPRENLKEIIDENEALQQQILDAHFETRSDWSRPNRALVRMRISTAFTINASKTEIVSLAGDHRVKRIELELLGQPQLIDSVPLVGMQAAYNLGATGSGWAVAILDTDFEEDHSFLTTNVIHHNTLCVSEEMDLPPNRKVESLCSRLCGIRDCGHGSHVAGIAAGQNLQYRSGEPPNGVGRSANILLFKIYAKYWGEACGDYPSTCLRFSSTSLAYALERLYDYTQPTGQSGQVLPGGVKLAAINLSGGASHPGNCDTDPRLSPVKEQIERLRNVGIPTIVSAGNDSFRNEISQPACLSSAIAVSSSTKSDKIADDSNISSQTALVAPGHEILSSVPLGYNCPNYTGPAPSAGGSYCPFSGTSMATPHVAGAWAAIKSAVPNATVDQILNALISTGVQITDSRPANLGVPAGFWTKPRIQIDRAIEFLKTQTQVSSQP